MGQYHPFCRWACRLSAGCISSGSRAIETFSRRLWSLVRPGGCFVLDHRQLCLEAVGFAIKKLFGPMSHKVVDEKAARLRSALYCSSCPHGLDLRMVQLLKRCAFAVEGPPLSSRKKQANRKFPPKRKYLLVSFHPHDRFLFEKIYPLLFETCEPYLCRPTVDPSLWDLDVETVRNRVRCSDFFMPLITSSYQNTPTQAIHIQFKTALELIPQKGPYWIFPLVMESDLFGDHLFISKCFTGLFLFEKNLDLKKLKKEFSSLIRMIFETRQVFR
ncbi:hypothetical protein [Candidatus Similichlamydia laticola]|uniref:TIR domain-containing protein n=1 Tax=Candidatus Similichlamydia laticola TaxID=2170265 RepID=A0A369KKC9_9BACT|nr:hypothetical protein [Candidatus Similichlamydia laticola]RDB31456.1 hypothetical protein HAT2_00439 [Candidatus Similichlamydia laticola]